MVSKEAGLKSLKNIQSDQMSNNLIDFFGAKFVKSISCDKPQQDQYDVKNLLNGESREHGFYTKYFIFA